jgi:hypothetical protein
MSLTIATDVVCHGILGECLTMLVLGRIAEDVPDISGSSAAVDLMQRRQRFAGRQRIPGLLDRSERRR